MRAAARIDPRRDRRRSRRSASRTRSPAMIGQRLVCCRQAPRSRLATTRMLRSAQCMQRHGTPGGGVDTLHAVPLPRRAARALAGVPLLPARAMDDTVRRAVDVLVCDLASTCFESDLANAGGRALREPPAVAGHSCKALTLGQTGPKAVPKRALSSRSRPPTRGIGQELDVSAVERPVGRAV